MRKNINNDEPKIIEEMQKPEWSRTDSFKMKSARVPNDTKQIEIQGGLVDNFYLKLNKFARFEQNFNERRNEWDRKFIFIKGGKFQIQANFGDLFSKKSQLSDRILTSAKSLFPNKGQLVSAQFKPEWRFVTGLGGHSVYETGITLHHVYGVPYIPASSIKGVLRSWIIYSKFENDEKKAFYDKEFCHVFGCPAQSALGKAYQGNVTFFDALPTEAPTIEPDIMNPHYPKWYSGERRAPVDTESPVPIFFLTVKQTPFQFIMATKPKQDEKVWDLISKEFWGKKLMAWLTEALSEHGIGAKTAVGYGYMTRINNSEQV